MKLGLINSVWEQAGHDTASGIRRTGEIGFDSIDIYADPLDTDEAERALVEAECRAAGLPVASLPCVALGLIDFNRSVREFHLDRAERSVDLAGRLGAGNVLLVLGEYLWLDGVLPAGAQWRWAVECVRALGEHAATRGVEIALELEPFPLSVINDVAGLVRFLDEVGHPSVKANLDISHLALVHQPPELLAPLRGRVAHVHISDCDGLKHGDLPPGRGVVDFGPYLGAIRELEMGDATVAIELEYAPDPDRIDEWVVEAYEATAKLMREAGLRA